jgi:hypothetical protein
MLLSLYFLQIFPGDQADRAEDKHDYQRFMGPDLAKAQPYIPGNNKLAYR